MGAVTSQPPVLSRRAFLGLTAGAALLTACGGSGRVRGGSGGSRGGGAALSAFRMEIEPYVSLQPQRFALVLVTRDGDFAGGPRAGIAFRPPGGATTPVLPLRFHHEGLHPRARGVYVIETSFPVAGNWTATVKIDGHPDAELAIPVTATPQTPVPGTAGRAVRTPTVADPMGTDPLCTRTERGRPAPCPLHDRSLDELVGSGTPVAVLFGTPARCQSRYCGPVLDQLLAVRDRYASRLAMVHVEIYRDLTSYDLVPATRTWLGETGEPFLFVMDGAGMVQARMSGAFATDEVTAAFDRVLGD